jgi:predicted regulator of Ras-like GTPase activity (Roadblock/LC7/MglB family)
MTIPFLDLFNKLRERFSSKAVEQSSATPPPSRVVRPSSDRLTKTFTPRPTAPREIGSTAPRQFAPPPRARELPPALAKALEPKLERAICLHLSDFLDQIPAEYVKPVEVIDANRPVSLKASELEKGMPEQKPSIPLATLYQQIPEIFLRSIAPSDSTRVQLPFDKVLEQFANVQVRSDQQRDERVPQLETPILQATIEDTEKFGTKMEPVESSILPPMPVKTATAEAIASAEPEAAVKEVVGSAKSTTPSHPVIKLSPSTETKPEKPPFPLEFKTPAPPPPFKIPFQFPPNGTGAPASERVPASSGPPVPPISSSPSPLKLTPSEPAVDRIQEPLKIEGAPEKKSVPLKIETEAAKTVTEKPAVSLKPETPARIDAPEAKPTTVKIEEKPLEPLQVTKALAPEVTATAAPAEVEIHEEEPVATDETPDKEPVGAKDDDEGPTITLALKPIFENIPIFQREGDTSAISDAARIKFPLDLVQPQLATGRVLIPAKTFQRKLAPSYRSLFVIDREETPVSVPLQEVLKNLPSGVLMLREDQQRFLPEDDFVTPISLKAKEDAERLRPAVAAPTAPAAAKTTEPAKAEPAEAPVEKKIDGKEVVSAACKLPGVAAVELMFPDGLSLAGNLPSEVAVDGLCAMAPTLLQRIDTHMLETKLGPLTAMTLQASASAITFLTTENVYLAALHKDADALASETRAKLSDLLEELSRAFAKPEIPHVDH